MLNDTRPLLYAAYHDNADAVKALIGYGVSESALDRLILCELLCGEAAHEAKRRKQLCKHDEDTDEAVHVLSWIKLLGTEEVSQTFAAFYSM